LRKGALAALALVMLTGTATGCTKLEQAAEKVSFLAYMRSSPAFDPYEAPRPEPAGAVPFETPMGDAPLAVGNTQADLQALGARVTNPIPMDQANLAHGQLMFERHCAVCHNANGQGQGPIVGAPPRKFPLGPTLVSPAVQAYSDGYIYAVIRQGRGLMPAYGYRMNERERWQVVNYVRQLQGATAGGAAPAGATTTTPQAAAPAADTTAQ